MNFHRKSTESQKCYGLFTPWEETRKPRSGRRPFVWASFCFRQRRPLCKQPKCSSDHCTPRSDVFAHSHVPLSYMCTSFLWYCPKIFNQSGPPRAFPSCSDAKSWQQIYPHVGQAVGKGLTVGPQLRAQGEREEDLHPQGDLHRELNKHPLLWFQRDNNLLFKMKAPSSAATTPFLESNYWKGQSH